MGSRAEDLVVDDTPLVPEDSRETAWFQFSTEIDDLLATGQYTWAQATLESIQETVEKTQRVTDAQRRAFVNIELGGQPNPFRRRR